MGNITKRKGWRWWLTSLMALFLALNLQAQVTVEIGTGTSSSSWPFYTLYEDARMQVIYDASEIIAGGGMAGDITEIAFNVITANSMAMNGFSIDMQHTSATTLGAFVNTGWSNVYSGTYTVAATGWQTIVLNTPFAWDGTSNLLVNVCFDNADWDGNSTVNSSAFAGKTWAERTDGAAGCSLSAGAAQANRPNVRLTITSAPPPPPPGLVVQVGSGTLAVGYPFYTFYMDSRTQYLYTAAEILAAGGVPGDITAIGFDVSSAYPYVMNGFNIDMQNYAGTSLSGFVNGGWTNVYSGTYSVDATGVQTIDLQNSFAWDGFSNLLVSVCFNNAAYGSNSLVLGADMPGMVAHQHNDLSTGDGCVDITTPGTYNTRANVYLTITPSAILPTGIVQGFVTNGFGVPLPGATVAASGTSGNFVTTSGPNGAYQIPDIAIGTYTMAAAKDGYNTVYVNNVLITEGNTTYQNFELPRPAMAVTPNPYSVTLNPNEMFEGALNINNNGDGTLGWTAEVVYMEESTLVPGLDPNIPLVDFNSLPAMEISSIGPGNGEALNSRNTMLCPDGSKFSNAPVGSDNGYTSTTSAGYKCYQQFLGVDGNFNILNFWAIFTAAPPATMNFNIEICAAGSTPGTVLTSLNVDAAPVNTGTPVIGYNTYLFTVELPSTAMSEGWISVQATTASPTFYWLNTMTGTGGAYQNAVSLAPERLAMCLSGGGASGWLTLGQYEGIVPRYTNFDNPAYFSAMGTEAGEVYQAEVIFTSDPNVGTVTVPVTMIIAGVPLSYPDDLTAILVNPITGQANLSWTFAPTDAFINFVVKRDGVQIGTTSANTFTDFLPGYGTYYYTVQAVYDEGLSVPAGPVELEWPNPTIFVNPTYIYDEVWVNNQAVQTVTISNTGEGTLAFSFPEWVNDDGGSRAPLAYCAASGGCDEYIGTVQFGTINNSSGCSGYADYTSISTEVEPGETYPITILNPVPWSSDIVGIYIDWNQDEDFDDANEFYTTTSSGGGATFTGNILVPDDAEPGLTRMRVRLQYGGTLSPCGTTSYGEVEDYTLDVQAGGFIVSVVPAQGTIPPGGNRTITVTWDATDFEPGFSYFQDLVVESNDLANPSVTIVNEMYVYVPAQFAGTVTNALTGDPLNGVLVTANPTGYFTTIAFDDGTYEQGLRINAAADAYLGNYFPVASAGTINSIDMFFYAGDSNTENLVVEFFDNAGVSMGLSDPFSVTAEGWYNVAVPGIAFNGPFYAMVHWNMLTNVTRFLGMDTNGPNYGLDLGMYLSGGSWTNLSGFGYQCVFLQRVNAFIGSTSMTLSAESLVANTEKSRLPAILEVSGITGDSGKKAGQMNLNNSRDFDSFQTMTDENGEYMLYVDAGRYNVSFEKIGFQTYVEHDTIALQGVVTPLDAQLWEESYPPSFVYAEVNAADTECVVTWGDGMGPYEIVYDDGSAENYAAWALPGNMNAVKFTPANYPVTVLGGKIYVGDGSFPNNTTGFLGTTFGAMIKDDDGPNGMPGTTLDSISVTVNNYGWVVFTGLDVEITDGNFYLVMVQGTLSPNCAPVGIDQNLPTLYRSYSRNISAGGNWVVAAFQDMMMRAIVSGVPSPTDVVLADNVGELKVPVKQRGMISLTAPLAVPGHEGNATYKAAPEFEDNSRAVTNYRLVRYSNFDPNGDPTLGNVTGLGNAINANTYTDGGTTWANLPGGWYAYGVAANYPNNYVSDTIVSNIVGHKILAEVTVNVSLTTGGSPAGAVVSLAGQAYPYEVYTATVPEDGQVIFPTVWYGPYVVEAMKVGFDDYMINVNITGNRVINIILLEKKYKPRNLYVDPLTLVATWDEPLALAVAEDFEGSVFPPAGWQSLTQSTTGWYATTNGGSSSFAIPPHTKYAVSNDDAENGNGCCDYLITPEMNWTDLPTYRLIFASYFDGSYGQMGFVEISTDAGATWTVIHSMVAAGGAWREIEIDLAQFSGANGLGSVWLAFHADDGGAWASGWAVDDIQIASGGVPHQGYGVFLDGTLVDNTPEQTFTYTNLNYGQEYLAGVAALYSSGYSELDTYLFRSAYLYPPDSLAGMSPPMTDYAHLTWLPPTSPTGLGDNQDRVVATETQAAADVVAVLTPRTFPQTNVPLASSRNVLYDNGPLVNSPGTGSGGADESILQTGLGMGTYGFGFQQSAGNSVADDFEVTGNWNIQNIEFFGYQTGSSTSSTFTGVFCRVYDGAPNAGGTVIWGDLVTNRMISTEWSNIYRNDNGPGGSTDRPVMRIVAETPGLTLSPGTYWVEWQTTGSLSSGPWVPAVTINGETTTGNALQYTGSWAALTDVGPQGLPFILNGTGGGGGGGAVPSNLLGYNLYRDDVLRVYVAHPQTEYFDLNLDPGTYSYHVTAVYDLTPYGFAGQTGESMIEGPVDVTVVYGYELPFVENFNTGLFETNQWSTDGANWRIAGQAGNPVPCAEFFYSPVQTDYGLSLTSYWINGTGFIDGSIFLEFDLKLDDVNATGDESLQVEVFNGSSWITVATYTAEGDMDWEMQHIDITSQAKNKVFRVRFNAKGVNTLDIFNWMIDNVHIYRECAAPTELTADVNLPYVEQVILNWVAPSGTGPGPSGWLAWDNGVNADAIGLQGGGTFNVAVRFTPTQLAQYAGTSLTKIRMFPYGPGGSITLKVWTGANASTLVLTQPVASYTAGAWNEFNLNTPIPVTGATELWFGYAVTHTANDYVAGCDAGPAVAGFGDMLSLDGSVWESMATAYGLNYNWNLQGFVETLDGVTAALQPLSDPTVYGPVSKVERGNLPALPGAALPVEVSGNRELVGYNIYRDDVLIGSTTETTYIDADEALTIGFEYCYNVTAVYEDCESPMSEVACVLLTNVPVVDNQMVSIYPNPSNNLVNIELTNDISHMVVYNYLGEVVYERVITKDKTIVLNVHNYEAGAYLVKFVNTKGESFTRKVVVTH